MEAHEPASSGQQCPNKGAVREKVPLQRKWVSEPSAPSKRSSFADLEAKRHPHRESLPCGGASAAPASQRFAALGTPGKLPMSGPMGAPPPSQDPQGAFAQAFPRGYAYAVGQPYPQHPQAERFLSGAKPQPGLEPHAWPFAGQLPSDDLYPPGHPGHAHPCGGHFHRKSPSLPSSYGAYAHPGAEPGTGAGEDHVGGSHRKEQKPKKPGKYICHYCGRACAKPSVLKKHIRSHTGERPYPCGPCGFSFKTKSNLYKHRKSHAHAIKASSCRELATAGCARGGEPDVHSDGEQSTDTDEEGVEGSTMLTDTGSPVLFEGDKSSGDAGGVEPAYADSAEELPMGSMQVPILIVPRPGGVPSPAAGCLDNVKQRLALRLTGKTGVPEAPPPPPEPPVHGPGPAPAQSPAFNLLSPHSKGSTDSGFFSRSGSESAEQQVSPPSAKSYEEIMFGRTWYYRPSGRARQAGAVVVGASLDMGRIAEGGPLFYRGDGGGSKRYPPGPCLLEPPSAADLGTLVRSNSVPTPCPAGLSVPSGVARGSHSFDDEMMPPDDVFYPAGLRRLRRQAAFEHPGLEVHGGTGAGAEADAYGHAPKSAAPPARMGGPEHAAYGHHGGKAAGLAEIATRKRRKEKSVGDEEDSPGHGDSSGSVDMATEPLDGGRAPPLACSGPSQSDSFDTCASVCSEDAWPPCPEPDARKVAAGNVISVIQHTNSLSRPGSFEKAESVELPCGGALSNQHSEQSDGEIFEDALGPEADNNDAIALYPSSLPLLPPVPAPPPHHHHAPHKLVRQPNIQVPEIRVTEEPDKPDREAEVSGGVVAKEPEKKPQQQQQPPLVVEEFQLPQRSDTLSQMPSEKLPPKKKRLRLADMEHSSGESSFESACTSLSRSPSQESNLSHSSSFSMSFDRDEGLKTASPAKQEESLPPAGGGVKQPEFLMVPGSCHASQHQQREMRRSSSEQAPSAMPATDFPEARSKSFDYGSLSAGSRQGELYCSASAMKERRRGYLVRQASLSVYPEAVVHEPGGADMSIKQEGAEPGTWPGSTGDTPSRTRKPGGSYHQHVLQQSISEDSLQDEPGHQWSLLAQGSSSEGEAPGQEGPVYREAPGPHYQVGPPLAAHAGSFWPRPHLPLHQQVQKLHMRAPGGLPAPPPPPPPTSPLLLQHLHLQQHLRLLRPPCPSPCPSPSSATPPGLLVPVRAHTHVPSPGSVTYTSVSQREPAGRHGYGVVIIGIGGGGDWGMHPEPSSRQRANAGVPPALTSPADDKRLLSPAGSLERLLDPLQERVKEERMYGLLLRGMGAVELGGEPQERMCTSPPAAPAPADSFPPPLQIITARSPCPSPSPSPRGRESPEELDVDEPAIATATPLQAAKDEEGEAEAVAGRRVVPVCYPSLRTATEVSWCFLGHARPCSAPWGPPPCLSAYARWRGSTARADPNPMGLATRAALALLRSDRRGGGGVGGVTYCTADTSPRSSGKLVSSVAWQLRFDQLKPELMPLEANQLGLEVKGQLGVKVKATREQPKEEQGEKEVSRQAEHTHTRIKIFEGGFKSNEEYVYVRGRGRGKYICEECGIRCKKPSMLKKHIRTHTDVRPYVCKLCSFAFKTKGNLTKHMKSKAHMKKCLELGVSVSVEDIEDADGSEEGQRAPGRRPEGVMADHQFSDADDSEEEGDEVDEEDEDEDDYDGDSTPKTRSRSASPQPYASVTSVGSTHTLLVGQSSAFAKTQLLGYFPAVPSIHITAQTPSGECSLQYQSGLQGAPSCHQLLAPPTSSPPADEELPPSPASSCSPRLSSPASSDASPCSSPCARRYLSPHRDLSPRRHTSPLRHPSPKRELGVAGGYRRESSPRRELQARAHLSPARRDYRRALSPLRALSPRQALSPRRELQYHSHQQGGAWSLTQGPQLSQRAGLLQGRHRGRGADMETEHADIPPSPGEPDRGGSHGNRSNHQVRSPFPMVPIGGIQMVRSAPATPGHAHPVGHSPTPQKSTSEEEEWEESRSPGNRGGEQEEVIQTCADAIASLHLAGEETAQGGEGGGRDLPPPPPSLSPPCPAPPGGSQHFTAPPQPLPS